jgi:6-phosphogluconate dehydrogenase
VFEKWNKSELDSYLIEITAEILRYKDEDGSARVEKILDSAGQVRQDLLLFQAKTLVRS